MAEVLLFHHAQGLTTGVLTFAEEIRQAGHIVHTPDFYEGQIFERLQDGVGYAQQVGFNTIIERGLLAASSLPNHSIRPMVYAGFSLGVLPAQKLAQTQHLAAAALLLHACVPTAFLGNPWPKSLPVQIHGMDNDKSFVEEGDLDAARELIANADHAQLFLYPGDQHLFTDDSLPDYNEVAARLLMNRVIAFLETVQIKCKER